MPDNTAPYLPAVRLAKRGKGKPKKFSRAERQRRRQRMIEINNQRRKEKRHGRRIRNDSESGATRTGSRADHAITQLVNPQ